MFKQRDDVSYCSRLIAFLTSHERADTFPKSPAITQVPLVAHYDEEVWPEGGLQPSIKFQNVTFSYPTRPQLPV